MYHNVTKHVFLFANQYTTIIIIITFLGIYWVFYLFDARRILHAVKAK